MSHQEVSGELSKAVEELKIPKQLSLLRQLKVSTALEKLEQQLHIESRTDRDICKRLATVKRKVHEVVAGKLPDANEKLKADAKLGREQVSERRALLVLISDFLDVINESEGLRSEDVPVRHSNQEPSVYRRVLDEEPVPYAGVVIKALIAECGYSQNEIGRRCGIPKHDLSRYISNLMQLRLKHVRLIAGAIGVQADDIVRLAFEAFLEDMRRP